MESTKIVPQLPNLALPQTQRTHLIDSQSQDFNFVWNEILGSNQEIENNIRNQIGQEVLKVKIKTGFNH